MPPAPPSDTPPSCPFRPCRPAPSGYAYECSNEAFQEGQDDLCALPAVSFRGAPCSDAAGPQVNYRDIAAAVRRGAGGRDTPSGERWDALVCGEPRWDKGQQSPWAPCRWDDDPPGLRRFQVWFDDPRSLAVKYGLVAELGLRGGGTWFLDALNYDCGGDDACAAETAAIWEAVRNTTSAS